MSNNLTFIKNLELPIYFFNNKFKTKKFHKFPFFTFKDGTPVLALNSYIQSENILSLSNESIFKIAYSLTHVVKFCELNKIKMEQFTENDLLAFANHLQSEDRENKTTIFILSNTLNFFNYMGDKFLNIPNYSVVVLKCIYKKNSHSKSTKSVDYLYHFCFPNKEPDKKRSPISLNNIERMYESINKTTQSIFVQKRNRVILKLLEVTGARVGEISLLKVEDIENIFKMENPTLKIRTLKRKGDNIDYRYIPVNKVDFNEINSYIKIYRSKVIKNRIGKINDEGYLLINENTGKTILPITISNEVNKIRKAAGIEENVCAHMFRHRFITNLFIQLIKQYDIQNKDQFRNNLMDLENLKVYIQQATGHKNVSSLDHYIDIAKSELTNMDLVVDSLQQEKNKESIDKEKKRLLRMLKNKEITTKEYINMIEIL